VTTYTLVCDHCRRTVKLLLSNKNSVIVATCCNHDMAEVANHMRVEGT
jgi:hypothetical protein